MKHKSVIFDLDGTLVDTIEDIAASMNKALKLRGYPELPVEEYRGKVGNGIARLAYLSLPKEARNDKTTVLVAAEAARFYAQTPVVHSRVYPGVPGMLEALKNKKVKTFILTNKPDTVAQKVITGIFPNFSFDCVQGETADKPRKPDPACVWDLLVEFDQTPANVVFAGDSEVDMETALAAGCFPLGVSWGYRSRESIEKAGARRIIDTPGELMELF